ncbi:MAG: hypothetical protein K940chlam9_00243 [Chlamydiae bacterium]|nr:hypothetical protein [Chlamydiota bacterium]
MPVPTKTHHTKRGAKSSKNTDAVSWREAAKRDIRRHSEGGQILRGSRFKENVTQRELAEAIGVSQHHISEMENGKRPIGKEIAKRFAKFFKVDYRIFL